MYAERSSRGSFNPGSMGVAVGINAVLIGALLYAAPQIMPAEPRPPLVPIDYRPPIDPPPPPKQPEAKPRDEVRTVETRLPPPPERIETVDTIRPVDFGPVVQPGPSGAEGGVAGGTGTEVVIDPPRPASVIVAPGIDPRYADALQPTYPAEERRAGREGRVVARVLVGADGRVKQVERVSAASDAFWRATEDQAKRRWRFTPGTRDGVPTEAWRVMTLTFRLEG